MPRAYLSFVWFACAFFALSGQRVHSQEGDTTKIVPRQLSHSFLVPNSSISIQQVRIKKIGGVPIVVGKGSDGKDYYSPDLFPNFQPNSIRRISLVNDRLVMITKDGKAFRLAYSASSGEYSVRSLDSSVPVPKSGRRIVLMPEIKNFQNQKIIPSKPLNPFPRRPIQVLEPESAPSKLTVSARKSERVKKYCASSKKYYYKTVYKTVQEPSEISKAHSLYKKELHYGALKGFKKLAESGDVEAMRFTAQMYFLGQGTSKNYKQAAYWYEKALNKGSRYGAWRGNARYALAFINFAGGNSFYKDPKKAVSWLREIVDNKKQATKEVLTAACYLLADAHSNMVGVTRKSNAMAKNYLDEIVKMGGPFKPSAKLALSHLK